MYDIFLFNGEREIYIETVPEQDLQNKLDNYNKDFDEYDRIHGLGYFCRKKLTSK